MTMVGLNREQRRILADKLPDMANVAIGGMVFGQFLSDRAFSPPGGRVGFRVVGAGDRDRRVARKEKGTVTGIYILFGGLALFTLGVLIFDLVTRPPGRRDAHK